MSQFKRPESALVIVQRSDGQVLRLLRVDPPDFWQSVTGSLQAGEAPAAAARRELLEETGLDAWPEPTGIVNTYPIRPEWRHRYAPDVDKNTEYVFHVRVPAGARIRINPREHVEYRWLSPEAAAGLSGSSTDAEAIRRLMH